MVLLYLFFLCIKTLQFSELNIITFIFVSVIARVFPVLFDLRPVLLYPCTLFKFLVPILYIIFFMSYFYVGHFIVLSSYSFSFLLNHHHFMLFPLIFLFSLPLIFLIFYDDLLVTKLYFFAFSSLILSDDTNFRLFCHTNVIYKFL